MDVLSLQPSFLADPRGPWDALLGQDPSTAQAPAHGTAVGYP